MCYNGTNESRASGDRVFKKGNRQVAEGQIGITTEEMSEAVTNIIKLMPQPGENEIQAIKNNPNLTIFQKHRLINM